MSSLKFNLFLVYEELEYGVLLPNDVNYSNLVRYVKKKFKVGDANQISLSYSIGSIFVNIIDDDDIDIKCLKEGYQCKVRNSCPDRYAVECVQPDCYWKAWRGKHIALASSQGCPIESFAQLPFYCYNLKKENEGTVTDIEMDDKGRFKMCFIGFGVAVEFKRISLTGFRIFTSHSRYRSISKQTTRNRRLKRTAVTPPNRVPSDLVSGGVTSSNISSTKHKERPLRLLNSQNEFLNSQNELLNSSNKLMEQMTTLCDLVGQAIQKKEEEKRIAEEQASKDQYWKIPICYDDDEDDTIAITPVLPIEEPDNSLSMGDEHLDTIPATESDKVIKSSVEDLVPIPSESEGIPDKMCDVPLCEIHLLNALKMQHSEIVVNYDDVLLQVLTILPYGRGIDYVKASPPDFPPADRSDFNHEEFADELTHIMPLPELECFKFKIEPDLGDLTSIDLGIRKNVSTTNVNVPFVDFPDCEDSRVYHSLELHILSFI
ncbi:hypothetical protein Tco_0589238 [Tanacetum coccineum]